MSKLTTPLPKSVQAAIIANNRFQKKVAIFSLAFIVVFAYIIFGGFALHDHILIFIITAALSVIGLGYLMYWTHLTRYMASLFGSLMAATIVFSGLGFIGAYVLFGINSIHENLMANDTLFSSLVIVVVVLSFGAAGVTYWYADKRIGKWAQKGLQKTIFSEVDSEHKNLH